jgi:ectoine hydroxylase-related dioxygenase (phytanoyl-CoA dioxygenase family)
MAGAGGQGIPDDLLRGGWRSGPFDAGDVVLFHSLNVHAGTPNRTQNRLRLSCDFRYQGVSQPVHHSSLKPHMMRFDWPYAYEGWQSKEHQYYWERMPLNVQSEDTPIPKAARNGQGGGGY